MMPATNDTMTMISPAMSSCSCHSNTTTTSSSQDNASVISDHSVDQLLVLFRQQEETCYQTTDYFTYGNCRLTVSNEEYERQYPDTDNNKVSSDVGDRECGHNALLMQWRKVTCVWSFRVAKFFGLNREVVTIAMNHLDRYLATVLSCKSTAAAATTATNNATTTAITTTTTTTTISKRDFQLWVLTSFYLAVKLNHGCCGEDDRLYLPGTNSTLEVICQLSDNPEPFDLEEVQQMELDMLQALDWYVHPPTPQSIVRQLWNPNMARQVLLNIRSHYYHSSSDQSILEHSVQWWYQKVYDHCCDVLDKALEEYEISLSYSCSEIAIATLLHVIDCCNFGNNNLVSEDDQDSHASMTSAPSTLLLSQWKLFLPTEFFGYYQSPSIDTCRQKLEEYLLQLQQAEQEKQPETTLHHKRNNSDVSSCPDDSEVVDLVESPPATKKPRIRAVPSPACIRDTSTMLL